MGWFRRMANSRYYGITVQLLFTLVLAFYLLHEFGHVISRTGDPRWSTLYIYGNTFLIIASFHALSFSLLKSIPDKFHILLLTAFAVYCLNAFFTYYSFAYISRTPNPSEYIQVCFKRMQTDSPWKVLFRRDNFFFTMALNISYILIPLALKGTVDTFRYINRNFQLQTYTLKLELNQLKSQLHPHFFLNTLNNIYSMVEGTDKPVAGYILKLSEIMRYSLYESRHEKVPLQQEIDFLTAYLDLERIRHNPGRVRVAYTLEGTTDHLQIPPVTLIVPVENAFKHGVNATILHTWVEIHLQLRGNTLRLLVRNNLSAGQRRQPDEGIGLSNLEKRLELYYPKNHQLTIREEAGYFEFLLIVNL